MDETLAVTDPRARLWPQTERLKAAVSLAAGLPPERAASLLAQAADSARGLWSYLETPTVGLWRDRALPGGGFADEPSPASSLYHIVGAVHALAAWSAGSINPDKPPSELGR
jgi:mannose/cellobiose epimerase-like protein (N-acyl-D-glucosamine 2-epimerase family)